MSGSSVLSRDFPVAKDLPMAGAGSRWLAGDRWEPATPRQASTVMLVRDGTHGTEVFMLRRVSGMAFAPNMLVFPGGGCDVRDGEPGLPWAGPSPAEWAGRFGGCGAAQAQMFVAAAVREVFEETGVLLAGESPDSPLVDVSDASWRQLRHGLVGRELSLAGVLQDAGLVLRSDLLAVKAHWLTPEFEPRRFDTWFFAALMPEHQQADGETSEADRSGWVRPDETLAAFGRGEAVMLPPTLVCLEDMRDAGSAQAFIRHTEHLPLIMPTIVSTPGGPAMRISVS
ncbi:MAG: NUDIX hydrolase [Intrasporangium sp.]|uniref:NUDIX hydrolase n=1 Tax=Intrasporangium sp. TaxID=1925024 RepID=UPI0026497C3A|nr:NUDIX hydrolase [Intrasporangium sp.]MDN5796749.1 NUDIX hydrolase [Intrasporangium sp.]